MTSVELKQSFSCGAVVWRRNSVGSVDVLLIKQFHNKDSWGIPKGHMHAGESFEACAAREVLEETGIDVTLGERLPDCETTWNNEHKIVVSFLAKQNGTSQPNTKNPDCEVADVAWFPIEKLPRIHVYQRNLIEYVAKALR